MDQTPGTVDCACVIHGSAYSWDYVENLHAMLCRNLSAQVRFHVYTEPNRPVPDHMIKHELTPWPEIRDGRAWWYKMQLFNPAHHAGPLLYFDLDTVVIDNIDWVVQRPVKFFNTVRDFKYLWSPNKAGINSSIIWWDTITFAYVWDAFCNQQLREVQLKMRGDQDFLSEIVPVNQRRYFESDRIKSWRWQCLDGGYNFNKRRHQAPGTGTSFTPNTSVLVFHGRPKPHEVSEPIIYQHWRP